MSKNNNFTFAQPSIPSSNQIESLGFDDFFDMGVLREFLPNFPPKSLQEIIRLVRKGKGEEISVFEWLDVVENESHWTPLSKDEEYAACEAIWTAICNHQLLGDIAFFKAALAIDGRATSIVSPLVETMQIARTARGLDDLVTSKIDWLLALRAGKYALLSGICYKTSYTPPEIIKKLRLPISNSYYHLINDSLVSCIASGTVSKKDDKWLYDCFHSFKTTNQKVSFLNQLICRVKGGELAQYTGHLVETHCLPSQQDSYWYSLSDESRELLKVRYDLSNFYELRAISRMLTREDATNLLGLTDQQRSQIKSRSMFWSNYSSRFNRVRALLPQSTYNYISSINREIPDFVQQLAQPDAETEVYLFELDNVIVVEFLRGSASETRLFNNIKWNTSRLFESEELSLDEIRAMSQRDVHDHVIYWQYFCEKLLRTKFKVKPNDNLYTFKGLPPEANSYSEVKGLPKPDTHMLSQRSEQLENWVDLFWKNELNTGKYGELRGLEQKSHIYLSKAYMAKQLGDSEHYDLYIKKAANQGNQEAMWQLGKDMLLNAKGDSRSRKHGEDWVARAASKGHKEAIENAKKFGIRFESKVSDKKIDSQIELCLKLLESERGIDHIEALKAARKFLERKQHVEELFFAMKILLSNSRDTSTKVSIANIFLEHAPASELQDIALVLSRAIPVEQEKAMEIYFTLHKTHGVDVREKVKPLVEMATEYRRTRVAMKGLGILSDLGDMEATYQLASILVSRISSDDKRLGRQLMQEAADSGHEEALKKVAYFV